MCALARTNARKDARESMHGKMNCDASFGSPCLIIKGCRIATTTEAGKASSDCGQWDTIIERQAMTHRITTLD